MHHRWSPPKIARGNAGVDLHPSQAELAFTLIRDPVSATDRVVCLGAGWRLYHVFTDGLWERGRGTLRDPEAGGTKGVCLEQG